MKKKPTKKAIARRQPKKLPPQTVVTTTKTTHDPNVLQNAREKRLPPPLPKKVPPPLPQKQPQWDPNSIHPLSDFPEGAQVDIPGVADMQGLTVERVAPGGVTVSGGRLSPHTVISGQSPARIRYERPSTDKEPGLVVDIPAGHGDFSSMPPGGTVTRTGRAGPPPLPGAPVVKKATGPKREGVCAFIDALIMKGGKTAEEIRDITLDKFPGRDANATLATVRTRPSHIKAKGLTPPKFKGAA